MFSTRAISSYNHSATRYIKLNEICGKKNSIAGHASICTRGLRDAELGGCLYRKHLSNEHIAVGLAILYHLQNMMATVMSEMAVD